MQKMTKTNDNPAQGMHQYQTCEIPLVYAWMMTSSSNVENWPFLRNWVGAEVMVLICSVVKTFEEVRKFLCGGDGFVGVSVCLGG